MLHSSHIAVAWLSRWGRDLALWHSCHIVFLLLAYTWHWSGSMNLLNWVQNLRSMICYWVRQWGYRGDVIHSKWLVHFWCFWIFYIQPEDWYGEWWEELTPLWVSDLPCSHEGYISTTAQRPVLLEGLSNLLIWLDQMSLYYPIHSGCSCSTLLGTCQMVTWLSLQVY